MFAWRTLVTYTEDANDLREKYYHSMGSVLTEEGDLEEAVVFYQKAIDIRETPFAWYGLARSLKAAGDIAGAAGAMTRAIKLAPGTAGYYHDRGLLLRELGRPDLAEEDNRHAVSIDKNYGRIDEITTAVRVIGETFFGPDMTEGINAAEIRNKEITFMIDSIRLKKQKIADVLRKPSCPVRACPAYCCHFTGKLLRHGVTIGPWKFNALRKYFAEKGLNEKDFLETFPVEQVEHAESLFSPQDIIKINGARSVVFPRQLDRVLGGELAMDIPVGRDHGALMWINEDARPCVFLEDGRCSIYDVGGEPSLDPCASFLCMTGFVLVVLIHLGIIDEPMIGGKTMKELNNIAVDALVALAQDVYGKEEVSGLQREILDELGLAIEGDLKGDKAGLDSAIGRCRLLTDRCNALIDENIAVVRQKIVQYFAPCQCS